MRRYQEIQDPSSCLNKARYNEWVFVLLGRDLAATVAVQAWIEERIRLGKNTANDPQITEARAWIAAVKAEQSAKPSP